MSAAQPQIPHLRPSVVGPSAETLRELKAPHYAMVPPEAHDPETALLVSHAAFRLYTVLLRHWSKDNRDSWPSMTTCAAQAGMGVRHAFKLLPELKAVGWISVLRARPGQTTVYQLPSRDLLHDTLRARKLARSRGTGGQGSPGTHGPRSAVPPRTCDPQATRTEPVANRAKQPPPSPVPLDPSAQLGELAPMGGELATLETEIRIAVASRHALGKEARWPSGWQRRVAKAIASGVPAKRLVAAIAGAAANSFYGGHELRKDDGTPTKWERAGLASALDDVERFACEYDKLAAVEAGRRAQESQRRAREAVTDCIEASPPSNDEDVVAFKNIWRGASSVEDSPQNTL